MSHSFAVKQRKDTAPPHMSQARFSVPPRIPHAFLPEYFTQSRKGRKDSEMAAQIARKLRLENGQGVP